MNKEKALFLILSIVLVGLFVLCGFSLIQCFVYGAGGEDAGSHVLEIIYLFLHLIMVAIVFYLAFRAFKVKVAITNLLMLDVNGVKITKSLVISGIVGGIFLFIGIYSTLHIVGLETPPLNIFPIGLTHDLMNAGYLIGVIALTCFIYPFIHEQPKNED